MGRPQFATAIVTETQIDAQAATTYAQGDVLDVDGTAYPYTLDPAETIEELLIHDVGASIDAEISTTGGSTFTIPVDGPATFNRWAVDSVTFRDPDATSAQLAASWAGES